MAEPHFSNVGASCLRPTTETLTTPPDNSTVPVCALPHLYTPNLPLPPTSPKTVAECLHLTIKIKNSAHWGHSKSARGEARKSVLDHISGEMIYTPFSFRGQGV
ncbi:hypothetical protein JZ751_019696 [Albula glossodonta]|uniref:Uncharacterized protein n=1 Tax=Albula glossodonta TaxID=121402 RepID=A0A8T2NLI6_9TELE|nr:hypothetical protein JZ751_019696 [Albula glossodonta]